MKRQKLLIVLFAVLGVAVAGGLVYHTFSKSQREVAAPSPASPEAEAVNASGRYLFNGSVFWGRRMERWSTRPDGSVDYAYPFSGLDTFNPAAYDAWIGELECPSSDTVVPMQRQEVELVFNCRPEFLPEAAKYFDILSLADNHTDNLGPAGFEETRQKLAQHGIQHFGHYDPAKTEDTCEVVGLPVRVQKSDKTETESVLPMAFCAWHYFYRMPLPGELEAMERYSQVMPVVAFLHMGVEYRPIADGYQRHVARRLVDLGAAFVLGNSPHWVQDSEAYKGRIIMYSTGNFMFDQQQDAEVTRSASLDVMLNLKYDDNVAGWLELGPECVKFKDDCLQLATSRGLAPLTPELTFGVVAGDNSNKLTKKASPELQNAVEDRLKWITIPSQL